MRKEAERSGNFVYGIINQIRARSEELCVRYGGPGNCLDEAEVFLTMCDTRENLVRLCLHTAPREQGWGGQAAEVAHETAVACKLDGTGLKPRRP